MALLTTAQIREHIETDLGDDALTRFLNDAEDEIVKRYGPHTTQTDTMEEVRLSTSIFLSRRASAIVSVTEEIRPDVGEITETVLSENDYKLRRSNLELDRLSSGDNARSTWGDVVTVVFTPLDETNTRKRVQLDLVQLAIRFNALGRESTGDYQAESLTYEKTREEILSRLRSGLSMA